MDRSILITGCSSGIGYDAAHGLKARGWRVFATCRNEVDCENLRKEGLESFRLDYDDTTSIQSAVKYILNNNNGVLGALFNNGAFACPGALEDLPRDALRAIFERQFTISLDCGFNIAHLVTIILSSGLCFTSM